MKISATIIDTYPDKKFPSIAIKMAQRLAMVDKIYTISDSPFIECDNVEFIKINPLTSNNQYGKVIFDLLPEIITDDFVLIFQWDGFPLNPSKWKNDFLGYDYIGAPLGNWVGQGGFSLRSRKLLKTLKNLRITIDLTNPFDQPEDQIICHHKRAVLEENGIKFAPINTAAQFSFDCGPINKNVLGFHGTQNFPIFLNESDLIKYADNITPRITNPVIMINYLNSCLINDMKNLVNTTLKDFRNKPNLLKTFQYLMATNPNSYLLKFFADSSA